MNSLENVVSDEKYQYLLLTTDCPTAPALNIEFGPAGQRQNILQGFYPAHWTPASHPPHLDNVHQGNYSQELNGPFNNGTEKSQVIIFPVYWEKYEVSIDTFMGICTWWFSHSGQGESQSCSCGTKNQAIFFLTVSRWDRSWDRGWLTGSGRNWGWYKVNSVRRSACINIPLISSQCLTLQTIISIIIRWWCSRL